jgi:hypothetical protein
MKYRVETSSGKFEYKTRTEAFLYFLQFLEHNKDRPIQIFEDSNSLPILAYDPPGVPAKEISSGEGELHWR